MALVLALLCGINIAIGVGTASAEPAAQVYSLDMIIDLALAKNPVVSSAEGNIEQQKGQQTAAGAYPNPTVTGFGGHGNLQDTGRIGIGPILDRQSVTEYNVIVGQPVEWPALRTARQRVADLGLSTANVGLLETRLNLSAQVKAAFYDLLLAQREPTLRDRTWILSRVWHGS